MKTLNLITLASVLLLNGCFYDAPISAKPGREIDKNLLGDWIVADQPTGKLVVKEQDASTYAISYLPPKEGSNEPELMEFRGYHTPVGSIDIVDLQLINAKPPQNGKWLFVTYALPEQDRLSVRIVNSKVVPFPPSTDADSKGGEKLTTPEAMEAFFKSVIDQPDLFQEEALEFVRVKAARN